MANIILHANDLINAARKMDDAANRIDGALQNLDTIMSDLDAVWSDENSQKYLQKYAELKENFPLFKEAVHSYSAFLNTVVNTYQKEYVDSIKETIN